jgi:hypothetical protein
VLDVDLFGEPPVLPFEPLDIADVLESDCRYASDAVEKGKMAYLENVRRPAMEVNDTESLLE